MNRNLEHFIFSFGRCLPGANLNLGNVNKIDKIKLVFEHSLLLFFIITITITLFSKTPVYKIC